MSDGIFPNEFVNDVGDGIKPAKTVTNSEIIKKSAKRTTNLMITCLKIKPRAVFSAETKIPYMMNS